MAVSSFEIRVDAVDPYGKKRKRSRLVVTKTVQAESREQAEEIAKAEVQHALDTRAPKLTVLTEETEEDVRELDALADEYGNN